jgi:hypothetical protein
MENRLLIQVEKKIILSAGQRITYLFQNLNDTFIIYSFNIFFVFQLIHYNFITIN